MSNRLINETSPYLLQHAENPVDWYPWGDEALDKAKKENKPVLVSIGYAACHWCHVMERESFEDEETAAFMNEHFINIKIDREERPDLDHIYMDAVQAITGSGGWPLNVFLTPAKKPFYGGTYFPPKPAFNRASWMDVLKSVHNAFHERRHEMDAQAENLTEHIRKTGDTSFLQAKTEEAIFTRENSETIARNLLQTADRTHGGFGRAPKFPQSFSIRYLLRFYHESMKGTGSPGLAKEGLEQASLSLDKMIEGGIYDQLGGGFARYSTDEEWLAPHFEKMLYDNALLVSVLAESYQLTRHERYAQVIRETLEFVKREMSGPEGSFYSALDADSEGVEGKFYVWSEKEVDEILGDDAAIFKRYYDVTTQGNWEHTNILRVKKPLHEFASTEGRPAGELKEVLEKSSQLLFFEREKRIRPLLDDKVLLGWNALMNSACSRAHMATGEKKYLALAEENMQFLLKRFQNAEGGFYHTWKERARFPAFLDDLAFLVAALIDLQEADGNKGWLVEAEKIIQHIIGNFSDEQNVFFYYTNKRQQDVILRKKELHDGALPSGNSTMAENLLRLSILLDRTEWRERALEMVKAMAQLAKKYPGSFGVWASLLLAVESGVVEIAVTGPEAEKLSMQILQEYIPHMVFQSSLKADPNWPLLREREAADKTAIWLCRNYTCEAPVFSVKELIMLINRGGKE